MVAYIYLLQEREFLNKDEHVYKIGKTTQSNLKRVSQYPNGSILKLQYECIDCTKIERELIKLFKKKYKLRKDIGYEYFEGDSFEMSCDISTIIQREYRDHRNEEIQENSQNNNEPYKCLECSKIFTRKFNLQRHMEIVHTVVHEKQVVGVSENRCHKCDKTFSRSWCLIRHTEKCTGKKDRYQCEHCSIRFTHEKSRFHHYKICKVKNKESSQNQNSNININTQNNNIIIIYNKDEHTKFKTDHLTIDGLEKILQFATPIVDSRTIAEYTKQVFSNPENRCIRNKNLQSSNSEIHTGHNKWSLELDKFIYPKLITDIVQSMSEYLNTIKDTIENDVFDKLIQFIGCIKTCEVKNEYNTFMKSLKLIVYENTKSVK